MRKGCNSACKQTSIFGFHFNENVNVLFVDRSFPSIIIMFIENKVYDIRFPSIHPEGSFLIYNNDVPRNALVSENSEFEEFFFDTMQENGLNSIVQQAAENTFLSDSMSLSIEKLKGRENYLA